MSITDSNIKHTTPANGNVFADLGFAPQEAAKLKIKSELMMQISEWIKENNMKQDEAADILQVNRPRVSDLVTGKVGKFTIDALVDMLENTGRHVSVHVA